jgi:CheY-like chemotaxis protein
VVDDEPNIRALLETALTHFGLAVWLASGGAEAVDVYRRHRAHIHVALLDVRMPDPDGPPTLELLRALNPTLPCSFMSGYAGHYSATDLLACGAAHVFPKPFNLGEMARALRELAGVPAAAPEPANGHWPERRRAPRRQTALLAVRVTRAGAAAEGEASVVNQSAGGLCLLAAEEAAKGTQLRVRATGVGDPVPWAEVVVCHNHRREDGWLLGCRFTAPPSPAAVPLGEA